jgi:rhamnogalacturonyl hydrolase YesR
MNISVVENCINEMLSYIQAEDFAGYDPYDALNSPLVAGIGAKSKLVKIAATQFFRRCPVNLRPLFGIKKGHNPKGIGLFLWGYCRLFALTGNQAYLEKVDYLLDLLDKLKSVGYSGNCWGYNFDWQSRSAMRPRGTPTIVNTAFIGHALLDCFKLTGRQKALDMAVHVKDFILKDIHRTKSNDTFCFSYTPIDNEVVHNANLMGASILARLLQFCRDDSLKDAVKQSLDYSMRLQRRDGSWFYADTSNQKWIDSFHTGFNLQAIRYIMEAGIGLEYKEAYNRGVEYYAQNFFLSDGTPKYYHDRTYPVDIHSPAQGVVFFSREGEQYKELTEKVLSWMINNLYSSKGFFYFRKGKYFTNRISYMRWSQAWSFHALTEYLYQQKSGVTAKN